ncbi:MAG TPA: ribbon-helix-helix domain-containing protein [Pseudolabrys sp.]|nr:ribbon-helix-helix domain-containing protein [Pseudolabrys sp.]
MKSAITKRSVVIGGHKTSVSLEEPFWSAVREIAGHQQVTVSSLLRQIDLERRNANLSSAIRVYVLENVRSQVAQAREHGDAHSDQGLWGSNGANNLRSPA